MRLQPIITTHAYGFRLLRNLFKDWNFNGYLFPPYNRISITHVCVSIDTYGYNVVPAFAIGARITWLYLTSLPSVHFPSLTSLLSTLSVFSIDTTTQPIILNTFALSKLCHGVFNVLLALLVPRSGKRPSHPSGHSNFPAHHHRHPRLQFFDDSLPTSTYFQRE